MRDPLAERMTKLETEFDIRMTKSEETQARILTTLEELVTLKNKGAGALWLVSLIGLSALLAFGKSVWYWATGQGT